MAASARKGNTGMNTLGRSLFGIAFVVSTAACDSTQSNTAAATASASAAVAHSAAEPPAPPPPAPADLNLAALSDRLDCPKHTRQAACRIVAGFQKAGPWDWKRPARRARWIGYQYKVDKGVEKRELIILFAKEIPTEQAGLGAMTIRIGTGTFPQELMAHAERLVRARAGHHGPSPRNQAPRFLSDFEPEKDWSAIQTDGASVLTVEANPAYIREQDRVVYYVKPDDSGTAQPGDGIYAELWVATW